jgi:hypothetical protein
MSDQRPNGSRQRRDPVRTTDETPWDILLLQLTHDCRDMALLVGLLLERPELTRRPQLIRPMHAQLTGMIERLSTLRTSLAG